MAAVNEASPAMTGLIDGQNRSHFLVDINKLFRFLDKRYFVIFYFGRHLHPRQRRLVNQRTWGNRIFFLLIAGVFGGMIYGGSALVAYRVNQDGAVCAANDPAQAMALLNPAR